MLHFWNKSLCRRLETRSKNLIWASKPSTHMLLHFQGVVTIGVQYSEIAVETEKY